MVKLKLKIWPLGPLFSKMYMARFARTGSTLVASGVPLILVLDITASSINNVHVEDLLANYDLPVVRVSTNLSTNQQWVIQQKCNDTSEESIKDIIQEAIAL